jgi:putative ABC transport system permease protein
MFDLDHWHEIYTALASNKLRTFLTAFGVFWGIFMLMVMLGSGHGLESGVTRDFDDGATNSFFVWTRSTSIPYRGLPANRSFELENGDIDAVRRNVPEAKVVAPRNQLRGFGSGNNVMRGTNGGAFNVMGDYPEIREIQSVRIDRGRFLNHLDLERDRKVAVIGTRVYQVLFEEGEDPIGKDIRVNGVYFMVVGTFRTSQSGDQADRDTQTVYVPFTTFQRAFNYGNHVGWFAITSQDDVPASVAEAKVIAFLAKRHRVSPDDERAFGHFNLEEEYNQIQGLFLGIRTLIWIVGIGTLAAGVIGVSNIMLVIVRERTHEIGVRRALGATPWSVMGQVLLEAIILTSIAGYLGMMAGTIGMDVLSSFMSSSGADTGMFRNPTVSVGNAVQALLVVILAGSLAGLMPARRAVALTPVQALRTEL